MNNIESLYHTISNCGYITPHLSKKYLNISTRTLDKLVIDNLLEKSYNIIFGKVNATYILSDKTKKNLRFKGYKLYKTNLFQLEHDYVLLHTYLNLTHDIRLTWLNETTLKEMYPENISTTDAMFTINNQSIALEVITPNYTAATISNKLDFAINYADRKIFINTCDIKF